MTMEKGKEQVALSGRINGNTATASTLTDSDYIYMSNGLLSASDAVPDSQGAIEGHGAIAGQGAPLVVPLNPRVGRRALDVPSSTPFGMLASPLMQLFKVESTLVDLVLTELRPRCPVCNKLAERPANIRDLNLPSSGYLALVLADDRNEISLSERCELLGVERVFVTGRILRVEELLGDSDGEPVLALVAASQHEELRRAVALWSERGGAKLRILHLEHRTALALELFVLNSRWSCLECDRSFPEATSLMLAATTPCARCRGEGWLDVQGARLISCEGCDGFGSSDSVALYEWRGVQLRHVAALPFRSFLEPSSSASSEISHLQRICEGGFGDYPIGAPVNLLSRGEQALCTLLSSKLSKLTGLTLLADGAALWPTWNGVAADYAETLRAFYPVVAPLTALRLPERLGEAFIVRDIERGPLSIRELSCPLGRPSLIQGGVGTGKGLLLKEIKEVFSKKRKLAQRCAFGSLKSCYLLDPGAVLPDLVIDLLGLEDLIAAEFCRTRIARERGYSIEDLLLSSSRYRCRACLAGIGECPECNGALIDWSIGQIPFGQLTFSAVLQAPLAALSELLWSRDTIGEVIRALPQELQSSLTLATPVASLPPATARVIYLLAALTRIGASKDGPKQSALATELILINKPFALAAAQQIRVWEMLCELTLRGATVVCADVPETLENLFSSVLRLAPARGVDPQRERHRLYDVRMARPVILDVVVP